MLNRRGTTWRKLDAAVQARVVDAASAIDAMLAHPSAIKRPVVEAGAAVIVGFDPADGSAGWATQRGSRAADDRLRDHRRHRPRSSAHRSM